MGGWGAKLGFVLGYLEVRNTLAVESSGCIVLQAMHDVNIQFVGWYGACQQVHDPLRTQVDRCACMQRQSCLCCLARCDGQELLHGMHVGQHEQALRGWSGGVFTSLRSGWIRKGMAAVDAAIAAVYVPPLCAGSASSAILHL